MRKILAAMAFFSSPVMAEDMVKPGTCELIVASRPSLDAARDYVRTLSDRRFAKVFEADNGWYAVSIGALKPAEEKPVLTKWKASGKIPKDSYCSTGKTYVALYDWKSGEQLLPAHSKPVSETKVALSGTAYQGYFCTTSHTHSPVFSAPKGGRAMGEFLNGTPAMVLGEVVGAGAVSRVRLVDPATRKEIDGYASSAVLREKCPAPMTQKLALNPDLMAPPGMCHLELAQGSLDEINTAARKYAPWFGAVMQVVKSTNGVYSLYGGMLQISRVESKLMRMRSDGYKLPKDPYCDPGDFAAVSLVPIWKDGAPSFSDDHELKSPKEHRGPTPDIVQVQGGCAFEFADWGVYDA
ncbi:hypothetical protein [Thalassobius sp. Cn5-15]|uniref:hypothetical protein n=1 Tax=Thalassobius sp. Cn5-15 TaxID=2917763 RepID=UPI001EF262F4|nr:hypothetical protein [Thalassobius sp. Cn5-15]MCG7494101.1 hypothetical protein [Thalassobius sp. Cn5-15]